MKTPARFDGATGAGVVLAGPPQNSTTNRTLLELESIVERGLETFIEVGQALAEIRDRKLYIEAGADTFEQYAEARFRLKRSSAYNYIAAAETATEVQTFGQPTYTQSMVLSRIKDPEQRTEIAKIIDFPNTSTRDLSAIVDQHLPPKRPKRKGSVRPPRQIDVNRIVGHTAMQASELGYLLDEVDDRLDELDQSQIEDWIKQIDAGSKVLTNLRAKLVSRRGAA